MSHPADNLIAAWLNDELDAQGVQELEDHLRRDPLARARFARFCQSEVVMTQALVTAEERPAKTESRSTGRISRRVRARRSLPRLNWAIPAAAAMIAAAIILTVFGRDPVPAAVPMVVKPSVAEPTVATPEQGPLVLLRSNGDVRYAGKPVTNGMQIPRGAVVEVLRDTAELQWRSDGSRLTVAAGSALRVDDDVAKIYLQKGSVEAHITKQVGGPFVIGGPHATTMVMGTRLTLKVTDGITELHVNEGRVRFTGIADRTAMELVANQSAQADDQGLRLSAEEQVLGFVPTAFDITRDLSGRMIGRGTLRLQDLLKDGFNLRIECRAGVRSVSISMDDIEQRVEQMRSFHLFGDQDEQSTRKWEPRLGTFTITAQPNRDLVGRKPLGPATKFELTIVP